MLKLVYYTLKTVNNEYKEVLHWFNLQYIYYQSDVRKKKGQQVILRYVIVLTKFDVTPSTPHILPTQHVPSQD